ncbi:MAG TPA: CPBP family intramembrane glutamic endopeptidase [Myxococcales bacterium]|nr:CPBP family intramembrane glutamic endopeptidase [Myxococcales bacterium]
MLFFVKRHVALDLAVTLVLGGAGLLGIRLLGLPLPLVASARALAQGLGGAVLLGTWTLGVQLGYRVFKGPVYARELTLALARQFSGAGPVQMLLGGATAAFGEELFFRGLVQQRFGLVAGALLFMAAHFGRRDIRVVSFWSLAQGLWLGLFFAWSGNLAVPMVAHGLFDIGGMVYFRALLARPAAAT